MTPPTPAGATPPGPVPSGRKLLARAAVALSREMIASPRTRLTIAVATFWSAGALVLNG